MAENSGHTGSAADLTAELPRPLRAAPAPRPPTKVLYFAYGSDMQIEYMANTYPSSCYIGRATLTDYRWQINSLGFANVINVRTAHAPGLVFELDYDDWALLDKTRFPSYKNVCLDAELFPAPLCLDRRQATWIADQGGPEAVLEREHANGRTIEARPSYTAKKIRILLSTERTDNGWPKHRYAEAINAAAADAMALGIAAKFFETQVEKFMPGRLLPILRDVRRPKASTSIETVNTSRGRNSRPRTNMSREERPGRADFSNEGIKNTQRALAPAAPPITILGSVAGDGGDGGIMKCVERGTPIYEEVNTDTGADECGNAVITTATDATPNAVADAETGLRGSYRRGGSTGRGLQIGTDDYSACKTLPCSDVVASVSTVSAASITPKVSTVVTSPRRHEQPRTCIVARSASINGRRPMSRFDRFLIQAAAEPRFLSGPWPAFQPRPKPAVSSASYQSRRRRMSF